MKCNVERFYTEEELVGRIWDVEDIKDLMSKRFYYNAADRRRDELNELWVTEPKNMETASFGRNWGYYAGMQAISEYYVVKHGEDMKAHLKAISASDPSVEDKKENLGIGCMFQHPVSTPLVELAGDGKTARDLWYCISQETISQPGGTARALWVAEKIGVDFMKENGAWKIWHMVIANDFTNEAGTDYAEQPVYIPQGEDPVENEFGTPTIPMLTHDRMFNWADNYPPEPKPYFSFSDENSYGPEGHPAYKAQGVRK